MKLNKGDGTKKDYYEPEWTQKKYDNNATAKGPNLKIDKNHEIAKFIEKKVNEKYSPEVIAELIKKDDRFEMDLVEGEKGGNDHYLLVLTERKSRIEIIREET